MEMKITFPDGDVARTEINNHIILTDRSVSAGGEGKVPSPLDYFFTSLGSCAGLYVLNFCKQKQIETRGLALIQRMEFVTTDDGKSKLDKITLEIELPSDFPEKYRTAVIKTAELCPVKKLLMNPPEFEVTTRLPPPVRSE